MVEAYVATTTPPVLLPAASECKSLLGVCGHNCPCESVVQ